MDALFTMPLLSPHTLASPNIGTPIICGLYRKALTSSKHVLRDTTSEPNLDDSIFAWSFQYQTIDEMLTKIRILV